MVNIKQTRSVILDNIIIFGAGGHASVVIDIIEKQSKYKIEGIFVDTPDMQDKNFMGYPVLGKINEFYGAKKGIVAIGDNYSRKMVVEKIKQIDKSFFFINAIHPDAVIGKNVKINNGTTIVAGAIINSNAVIGENCIINTNSSVGHDVKIGSFSSVAPGVSIGGNSRIGSLSTISMGSNVIQKVNIGNGTLVGAGSTVIKDLPDNVLAYGTPAKVIRKRKINEKYL